MSNPLTRLIDPVGDDRERVARKYQLRRDYRGWAAPLGVGVLLIAVSLLGLAQDGYQFWYAYLIGWLFCLSISLGALFFVMFQHITKAKWVTVVRRFPEAIMANLGLLAVFGLPLLLPPVQYAVYHWSHKDLYDPLDSHFDEILVGKAPYFFGTGEFGGYPWFWALRLVAYFALWITVATKLYGLSVRHDTEPTEATGPALRRVSAWGIPTVAVTTAFAGFDLLMSTDPHWFSTMFGVYFFAGGFLASIAATTLLALSYHRAGYLAGELTVEHFHDLGKYLFAFTVFWTYIAFSQYMLIWYGNLPEETIWFQHRTSHGWEWVTQGLIWFHFVLPFFILIPKFTKRILPVLAFMCGWILVMHFIDLFWLAKPSIYLATGESELYEHAAFSWMDIALWLGFLGLFAGATVWRLGRHAVAPYNDPYYAFSLRFENV